MTLIDNDQIMLEIASAIVSPARGPVYLMMRSEDRARQIAMMIGAASRVSVGLVTHLTSQTLADGQFTGCRRAEAYSADIVCGEYHEFLFDALRDIAFGAEDDLIQHAGPVVVADHPGVDEAEISATMTIRFDPPESATMTLAEYIERAGAAIVVG
jgi:hypothetical protein